MIEYHAKQLEALSHLQTDSDVKQVLYGGSAGGGKSFLGCDWQIKRRLKFAGTRGLIGRAELKKLRLSTMQTFFELCSTYGLIPGTHFKYNGQDHVINWYNGSQTILMDLAYLPSDPDYQRFGSLELTDYFVDEAAEVTPRCIQILQSRVRYKLPDDKQKGLLSCNPHKGWLYNEFYLPNKNNELPTFRKFVQALPTDNPHLSQTYLDDLDNLNEYDKRRLKYGEWEYDDDTAKLFFTSDLHAMFRSEEAKGEKYITADVARLGQDKTVIMLWHGLSVIQIRMFQKQPLDVVIGAIKELRDTFGVSLKNIVVDEDGIGGGVVDALKCTGFQNGSKAKHPEKYMNLKSECYFKLAEYVSKGQVSIQGVSSELKQRIISEIETVKRHNADKDTRLQVTPKDKIKADNGFSPDYADCLMMRMYHELFSNKGNYLVMGIN